MDRRYGLSERKKQVLIVEDDVALRRELRESLQARGFDTLEAGDGESARNQLAEHSPDLVCLDLVLPESSGYELCDYIRASAAHRLTQVLMMSDRVLPGDRAAAMDAGANDYLPKPFSRAQLLARIAALLDQRG